MNTKLSYISILQKLCEFRTKSVRRRIQKGEWTFFFTTDKIKLLKKSQMCDDVAGNYYHWKEEKNICENADTAILSVSGFLSDINKSYLEEESSFIIFWLPNSSLEILCSIKNIENWDKDQ